MSPSHRPSNLHSPSPSPSPLTFQKQGRTQVSSELILAHRAGHDPEPPSQRSAHLLMAEPTWVRGLRGRVAVAEVEMRQMGGESQLAWTLSALHQGGMSMPFFSIWRPIKDADDLQETIDLPTKMWGRV